MSVRRMYFVELYSSRSGYHVGFPGILNTPALLKYLNVITEGELRAKHEFSTIVKSEYWGN